MYHSAASRELQSGPELGGGGRATAPGPQKALIASFHYLTIADVIEQLGGNTLLKPQKFLNNKFHYYLILK